jgi:hypothetical protein
MRLKIRKLQAESAGTRGFGFNFENRMVYVTYHQAASVAEVYMERKVTVRLLNVIVLATLPLSNICEQYYVKASGGDSIQFIEFELVASTIFIMQSAPVNKFRCESVYATMIVYLPEGLHHRSRDARDVRQGLCRRQLIFIAYNTIYLPLSGAEVDKLR